MEPRNPPLAKGQTRIRKPASAGFAAFVDPAVTTRFRFTRSSGRLEAGKHVRWSRKMCDVRASVQAKEIDPNKSNLVEWGEPPRAAEWPFASRVAARALDSRGGFTIVRAAFEALLEQGMTLSLVADQDLDVHPRTGA